MKGLIKTHFIPIRIIPFMDSSLIFQGITEDAGIVSLLARGYKRPKSRIRGEIDIFSVSSVHFFIKDTREVHTIRDARLVYAFHGFIENYESVKRCSDIGRIIIKITTLDIAKSIFSLYKGLLRVAHGKKRCTEELYYGAVVKILHIAGVFPPVTRCVKCGSTSILYISPAAGGPLCEKCAVSYPDRIKVEQGLLKELFFLLVKDFESITSFKVHDKTKDIINMLMKEHLYEYKKSAD